MNDYERRLRRFMEDRGIPSQVIEKNLDIARKARPLGCALAMRVMQSDLYKQLDEAERADCDELVRQNVEWFKRDMGGGKGGKQE